eukprot:scaffold142543_cov30-Prasinocladus_malaysianus.AAC.2
MIFSTNFTYVCNSRHKISADWWCAGRQTLASMPRHRATALQNVNKSVNDENDPTPARMRALARANPAHEGDGPVVFPLGQQPETKSATNHSADTSLWVALGRPKAKL